MIQRKKHRYKKPLNDATRAAQCDAVMGRPNDNPYRKGTLEHEVYEQTYRETLNHLRPDPDRTDPPAAGTT